MNNLAADTETKRDTPYAWYVVTILLMAGITSYLDRNVVFLLVGPIQETLHLSDTEVSLLEGLAFASCFIVLGFPLGALVDRINRRNLIIAGVLVWGVMTFACGLARNYQELFVARMGVGCGEAILGPAAFSIIGDYFSPKRRAKAASVYNLSNFLSGALSSIVSGVIVHSIGAMSVIGLPVVGETIGWRIVFFVAAIPAFFVALLLLTVREPQRREAGAAKSVAGFGRHLSAHRRTYIHVYGSYAAMTFVGLSTAAWGPTYLVRSFGIDPGTAGMLIGLAGLFAIVGALASGWISDQFAASETAHRFRTPLVGWPILIGAIPLHLTASTLWVAVAGLAVLLTASAVILVSCPPVLQDITPNRFRGRAQSLFFILSALLGLGIAPTIVAIITDQVFGDPAALRYSLLAAQTPVALLGGLICLLGQRHYSQSRREVEAGIKMDRAAAGAILAA